MKKNLLTYVFVLTFLNAFSQTVPSYVPVTGLVAYYPFNGNANDVSGNGNNGNVSGSTQLTTDRFSNLNTAYIWNGTNSPITVLNNATQNFQGGLTFSVWLYQTGMYCNTCTQTNYLTKGRDVDMGGISLGLDHNTQKFSFKVTGSPLSTTPPDSYFLSESLITYNTWTNLVGTYDGSTIKIYINGILDKSYSYTSSVSVNIDNMLIGKQKGTGVFADNYNMLGKLDDIGVWNRALTQDEITSIYYAENTCQALVINTGVLSFNPVTYNNTVTIYPNPANTEITIDCGNLANVSGWNIKIYNTLGQEMFSAPMNTQQYTVQLNTWTGTGMYFVKIYDSSNNIVNTKKIILQ